MSTEEFSSKLYSWDSDKEEDIFEDDFQIIEDDTQRLKAQFEKQAQLLQQISGLQQEITQIKEDKENLDVQLLNKTNQYQLLNTQFSEMKEEVQKLTKQLETYTKKIYSSQYSQTETSSEKQANNKKQQQFKVQKTLLQKPYLNNMEQLNDEIQQYKNQLERTIFEKNVLQQKFTQECINNDLSLETIRKLQKMLEEQTIQQSDSISKVQKYEIQVQEYQQMKLQQKQTISDLQKQVKDRDRLINEFQLLEEQNRYQDKVTIQSLNNQINCQKQMLKEMDAASYFDIVHSKVIKDMSQQHSQGADVQAYLLKSFYRVLKTFKKNLNQHEIHLCYKLKMDNDADNSRMAFITESDYDSGLDTDNNSLYNDSLKLRQNDTCVPLEKTDTYSQQLLQQQ